MSELDLGYAEHTTLAAALWAAIKRTVKTWRYARSIGADPTIWWGVYQGGSEVCLASVGPLPGAKERAGQIIEALSHSSPTKGGEANPIGGSSNG